MSTTDRTSETDASNAYRGGLNRWPVFDIEFVIESTDLGKDQCTLYPRGAEEEEMMTEWVTADENAYVSLSDVR